VNGPLPKPSAPKPGVRRPNPAASGNVFVGNILVGLGLGWVAQHYFPGLKPWGYAVGLILGFASGLWQLLRGEGMFKAYQPKRETHDPGPRQP
jgi:ATP synthase protein I